MENKANPLEPAKIVKSISSLIDGKFDLVSLSRATEKDERIRSTQDYVIILPFDRTDDNKLANIYCRQFENPATDGEDATLIIDIVDDERDETSYDTIGRSLLEEAGLNLEEEGLGEDETFYIGQLTLAEPVGAKFKCYAVDITKISKPGESIDFTTNLSKFKFIKDSSEIVKVGFHQIVNGDYSDALILAGAFLLVSYFQ